MPTPVAAQDRIFQTLAGIPSRRAIFESLGRGEAAGEGPHGPLRHLAARGVAISSRLLEELPGLVAGRRRGAGVYYRVNPRGMKPLID